MPPRSEEELIRHAAQHGADAHGREPHGRVSQAQFFAAVSAVPTRRRSALLLYCKPQHALRPRRRRHGGEPGAVAKHLPADLYEHLDASILSQTSPEEAYRKYDHLAGKHADELRRLTKKIQDAAFDGTRRRSSVAVAGDDAPRRTSPRSRRRRRCAEFGTLPTVERILKQSAEFCGEHETWRLNMAHTYFMQSPCDEEKYITIRFYEPSSPRTWKRTCQRDSHRARDMRGVHHDESERGGGGADA